MAAGIPLVESGTAGYLGQVQPLWKVGFGCPVTSILYLSSIIYRIVQSASIVYRNLPQNLFRSVRSGLHPRSPYTVLSGRKAISFRAFQYETSLHMAQGLTRNAQTIVR